MTNINAMQSVGATLPPREERLRDAVTQLEGVFVEQLFKAMRHTVPSDGLTSGGAGEEMFTGLMDQHLASEVPTRWGHSLADALVRQLQSPAVPTDTPDATAGRSPR